MPNYERYLRRTFSWKRLVAGVGLIALAGLVATGCTSLSGSGGLAYLALGLPLAGLGLAMVIRPYALRCKTCGEVASTRLQSIPAAMSAVRQAQGVASSPDAAKLEWFAINAPLPDVVPSPFCAITAKACPCGQSAYLELDSYTTTARGAMIDKSVMEFGGEIGPSEIALVRSAGAGRWEATRAQRGFDNPFPPNA